MKTCTMFCLFAVLLIGCAGNPAMPGVSENSPYIVGNLQTTPDRETSFHDPHKLWAAGKLYIDADHEKVEIVPFRFGGIHLNVLKFVEASCDDCVLITGASDNGDGTINLSIRITHPFPNHKELTVFDPKLILMFQGSDEIETTGAMPLYPQNNRLSWRLMGDPEILNPDGFTYRWSPWYDSGYPNPIFNYWEGKYAFGGTPSANINGYLNYYSNENRHMLESGASVEHSFHLSLPTGPIVAGYALDVCWEPPTVMPVVNPADDFPITANQPECYKFEMVYNNGEVITNHACCNEAGQTVDQGYLEFYLWYKLPEADPTCVWAGSACSLFSIAYDGCCTIICDSPDPEHIHCAPGEYLGSLDDGFYQFVAIEFHVPFPWWESMHYPSYDVFEIEIDFD